MKLLFVVLALTSCAHKKTKSFENDMVSVEAALTHAQFSYLKGCVDALKELKVPVTFPGCRDKSILHRQEIESIMIQE